MSCPQLVGRGEELAYLGEAFKGAVEGQPSIVLVSGEAGIGKTRLVNELAATVRRTGARVWMGHCPPNGEYLPYAPIVELLHAATPSIGVSRVRELASNALTVMPAQISGSDERAAVAWTAVDGREQIRQWARLLRLLNDLADEPTLIVIEDLHWADVSTRGLLSLLVRGLAGPLLVVCTFRDDQLLLDHPLRSVVVELQRAGAKRVALRRFDLAETAAQIAGILDEQLDPTVVEGVFRRSGGNPFLVEELVAAGHDEPELPPTLSDVLLLRLNQLPDDAKSVVRAVALAGGTVEHGLLSEALELPAARLNAAIEAAVQSYVLVPEGLGYCFRHALVAEAAVADTLPGERIRLHRAFGRALDARLARSEPTAPATPARVATLAQAAHHWFAAEDPDRALTAAVAAALAAERGYAFAEAYGLFRRALDLWWDAPLGRSESPIDLAALYEHTAHVAYAMGDAETALALLRQSIDKVDETADPLRAGMLHRWLGRYLFVGHRPLAPTLRAFETAVRLVPAAPTRERAEVMAEHAGAVMLASRPTEAVHLAQAAAAVAEEADALVEKAHAIGTLGVCQTMLGDTEAGLAHLRSALSISTGTGDPIGTCRAYLNLSCVLCNLGSLAEAADTALAGLDLFQDGSVPREYQETMLGNALEALYWLGRWDEVGKRLAEFREQTAGQVAGRLGGWLAGASACTAQGDFTGAEQHLDVCRCADTSADVVVVALLHVCRAELDIRRGRSGAALASVVRGLEALADADHNELVARLLAAGARVCADLTLIGKVAGHAAVADDLAARSADLRGAERLSRLAVAHLGTAEGELARAVRSDDAGQVWDRAAGLWDQLSAPYPKAYARWRQAEALLSRREHRRAGARALVDAADVAARLGAEPLHRDIELLARRARLDLRPSTTVAEPEPADELAFGLTARELAVLLYIAQGDTNREIARSLFISEKTVSVHVSRILAKMGVANRAAAAATAHQHGMLSQQ